MNITLTDKDKQRFWAKIVVQTPDDCWAWLASRDSKGYGYFRLQGKNRRAHRIAWLIANDTWPEDLFVCHRCDHPWCCNPQHLYLGTNGENVAEAVAKGRFGGERSRWRLYPGGKMPIKEQKPRRKAKTPADGFSESDRLRFWSKVDVRGPDDCWDWTACKLRRGYGHFTMPYGCLMANRVAWILTHGEIPSGLLALHRCDRPSCCNPSHLFLGTVQENVADRNQKGRQAQGDAHWAKRYPEKLARGDRHFSRTQPERLASGDRNGARRHPEKWKRGEEHHWAKLTWETVRALRAAADTCSIKELASTFSIDPAHVRRIVRRLAWKNDPLE